MAPGTSSIAGLRLTALTAFASALRELIVQGLSRQDAVPSTTGTGLPAVTVRNLLFS